MKDFVKSVFPSLAIGICCAIVLSAMMLVLSSIAGGAEIEARERVFDLPQDEGKWFVSVVGEKEDERYNIMLSWFGSNADLAEMKSQVHFHEIIKDSIAFKERYAKNVSKFPTIRVQKANGYVVYEASGDAIPDTAARLLAGVGRATLLAGGPIFNRDGRIFPVFPIFRRPFLPYRYRQEELRRLREDCDTCPPPVLPPMNIEIPRPPVDKGTSPWVAVSLIIASFLGGAGGGLVSQIKKKLV